MTARLAGAVFAVACVPAAAQIVQPSRGCGPAIHDDTVLVIDLESYRDDTAGGQRFLDSQLAGVKYELGGVETLATGHRGPMRNIVNRFASALKQLQHIAAKRGCNLVVVVDVWDAPTGVVSSQQAGAGGVSRAATAPMAKVFIGYRATPPP